MLDFKRTDDLHVVGRLDADTTGLVLITDDGRWSFHITSPESRCKKVYRVILRNPIQESTIALFKNGLKLQGEVNLTQPSELTIITPNEALLSMTEGKFHQVKRMFASIGNRVLSLHRESIGCVSLDINQGEWRFLTPSEVESLRIKSV